MRLPFLSKNNKQKSEQSSGFVAYEEIQEKRTTKFGYFLLMLMVIIGVYQGHRFIESMAQHIKNPTNISSCGYYLRGLVGHNNYDIRDYNYYDIAPYDYSHGVSRDSYNCQYSELEKKFGIEAIVLGIRPLTDKVNSLSQALSTLQNSLYELQGEIDRKKQSYDITLQEKMAQENSDIYDKNQLKTELTQDEQEYKRIELEISEKETSISKTNALIEQIVSKYEIAISDLFDEYYAEVKKVELERALLQLLLITPLLFLATRRYFRQKKSNSPYAIIWGAICIIFAILFIEVSFTFIYKIIPHELIAKLMELFGRFEFLVTIAHYLLLLLTPAIFGGIVYLIQRKVYNKQAVMIRALKSHRCPSCSMSLHEENRFCPVCHYQIKEKCIGCNADRIVGLKFCPSCGSIK